MIRNETKKEEQKMPFFSEFRWNEQHFSAISLITNFHGIPVLSVYLSTPLHPHRSDFLYVTFRLAVANGLITYVHIKFSWEIYYKIVNCKNLYSHEME